MLNIKKIDSFKLYGQCLSIDNGIIEAIITLDVGPRIISFSFINGTNVMLNERTSFAKQGGKEFDDYYGKGEAFENFGGHRLWVSPESLPETYYPDCKPVTYEINNNTVLFTQTPQKENGVQLSMEITMDTDKPEMKVNHTVKNISKSSKEYAPWALSVMNPGGIEIIPQNTNDTGLLANRRIVFWPYASVKDERLFIGDKYITLRQNPKCEKAFKLGTDCNAGTGYYVLDDVVFSKSYNHICGENYPDGGVSYETYTNNIFLEFETLGELKTVNPGETSMHEETFKLYKKPCDFDPCNEISIEHLLEKL